MAAPTVDPSNIQGDIHPGFPKKAEEFIFFEITDAAPNAPNFCTNLGRLIDLVSTGKDVADGRNAILDHAKAHGGLLPIGFTNIAFSAAGLGKIGIRDNTQDKDFHNGMFKDADTLGDVKTEWKPEFAKGRIHGVILVAGDSSGTIAAKSKEALYILGNTVKEVVRISGHVRPAGQDAHEHFGYRDGISHPSVEDLDKEDRSEQGFVQPGVFVLGRPGDHFQDDRPEWAVDGSFLAFRYLVQHVPEFDSAVKKQAALVSDPPHNVVELTGARMVGRWKSGAPLPEATRVDQALALDEARLNNFDDYGGEDQGVCPFAAHTRKMNPRGDLPHEGIDPHRILRRGIPFGPEVGRDEKAMGKTKPGRERGLLFASYQSSLDGTPGSHGGFAFLQKSWANNKDFPINKPVVPGLDPLIGATGAARRPMSGLVIGKPKDNSLLDRWVVPRGGEYFFVPSISTLSDVFAKVRSAQQSDL